MQLSLLGFQLVDCRSWQLESIITGAHSLCFHISIPTPTLISVSIPISTLISLSPSSSWFCFYGKPKLIQILVQRSGGVAISKYVEEALKLGNI